MNCVFITINMVSRPKICVEIGFFSSHFDKIHSKYISGVLKHWGVLWCEVHFLKQTSHFSNKHPCNMFGLRTAGQSINSGDICDFTKWICKDVCLMGHISKLNFWLVYFWVIWRACWYPLDPHRSEMMIRSPAKYCLIKPLVLALVHLLCRGFELTC